MYFESLNCSQVCQMKLNHWNIRFQIHSAKSVKMYFSIFTQSSLSYGIEIIGKHVVSTPPSPSNWNFMKNIISRVFMQPSLSNRIEFLYKCISHSQVFQMYLFLLKINFFNCQVYKNFILVFWTNHVCHFAFLSLRKCIWIQICLKYMS